MKTILFIISIISTLTLFGQQSDIEDLINQIAKEEMPKNFKYYYLVQNSLEHSKINDSIQNTQLLDLKKFDESFPKSLLYKEYNEKIDWKNYELKNVRYVSNEFVNPTSPPRSKKISFVKYNIKSNEYDSLVENKEPYTLIVKKKWIWNKNKIWENKKFYKELVKAWKIDKEANNEENIFFRFSKPIFSESKKYAIVSVWKDGSCKGNGFTALYRNENGIWEKILQYNQMESLTISTHLKCEEISISY